VLLVLPGSASAQSVYDALRFNAPPRPSASFYIPAPIESFDPPPIRRAPAFQTNPSRFEEQVIPEKPVMPAKAKPPRAAPDAEIVASVLKDPTLRRGDIVVFPDGPRVFRGDGTGSHRARDFEDLRASRLVDNRTRTAVLASTSTVAPVTVAQVAKPRRAQRESGSDDVAATGSVLTRSAAR
jgi:hypothetical protein